MNLADVTAIGRILDPRYRPHQAVMAASALTALVVAAVSLWTGASLLPAALAGLQGALTVFLAWAIARELDPDHELSAFVGLPLVLAGLALLGFPNLLVLFWVLLITRMLNRTTGLPLRWADTLAVVILGAWLTWQVSWVFGLLTTLAFWLDSRLPAPLPRHLPAAGLMALVTAALVLLTGVDLRPVVPPVPQLLAAGVVTLLFLPVLITSRSVQAVGDATQEALEPRRVLMGQEMAVLAGWLLLSWEGSAGFSLVSALWAAILGVSLYRLGLLWRQRAS